MTKSEYPEIELLLKKFYPIESNRNEIISLLKKYQGLQLIDEGVSIISSDSTELTSNIEILKLTFAGLIKKINDKVDLIEWELGKMMFKQVFKSVFEDAFEKYILPKLQIDDLESMDKGIEALCKVNNYNYADLISHFNIHGFIDKKRLIELSNRETNSISVPIITDSPKNKYFNWLSSKELNELTSRLKDKNWIKSKRELEQLFESKAASRKLTLNRSFTDEILYLFDCLIREELIQCRGSKGHFDILLQEAVDFDEKEFMEKTKVKKRMYNIRHNKGLLEKVEKHTRGIIALLKS